MQPLLVEVHELAQRPSFIRHPSEIVDEWVADDEGGFDRRRASRASARRASGLGLGAAEWLESMAKPFAPACGGIDEDSVQRAESLPTAGARRATAPRGAASAERRRSSRAGAATEDLLRTVRAVRRDSAAAHAKARATAPSQAREQQWRHSARN